MIYEFPNTPEGEKQALAISEPKEISWEILCYRVRTGPDMTPPLSAQEQIAQLEAKQTARMLREAALGIDKTRLAAIDAQIVELRKKL